MPLLNAAAAPGTMGAMAVSFLGVIAALAGAILAVVTLWVGVRYVVEGWLASSISFTSAFISTRDVLLLSPWLILAAIALAAVSSAFSLSKYTRV